MRWWLQRYSNADYKEKFADSKDPHSAAATQASLTVAARL
jgi:hypothetical protein